jgi:hypothetical protein
MTGLGLSFSEGRSALHTQKGYLYFFFYSWASSSYVGLHRFLEGKGHFASLAACDRLGVGCVSVSHFVLSFFDYMI